MITEGSTAGAGPVVAHRVLGEPDRKWLAKATRPVPDELFPDSDQALVLRTDAGLVAMDWGQVPDPAGGQWVKARAATLVRRQWSETVFAEAPSQSPDRRFRVRVVLRGTLTSAVAYLSADSAATTTYQDGIGTTARDLGKDYDARQSTEFETSLRARLTGWIRVRRTEVPGVEVELGLVEVTPPEEAIKAHKDRTSTLWNTEHDELVERLRNERDELAARLRHQERLGQARRDDEFLTETRNHSYGQEIAEAERTANLSAIQHQVRLLETDRQAEFDEKSGRYELKRVQDEYHLDGARLRVEDQRRSAEHRALVESATEVAGLLEQTHGAAGYGLVTGKVEPASLVEAQLESARASESKFYALLVYLIENDKRGELDLGDSAKQLIMMEMRRLSESMDHKPGGSTPQERGDPALDSGSVIEADPFDG